MRTIGYFYKELFNMTDHSIFRGAATALVTPLTKDGVDYENFGRLIDWLGFGTAIQILPVSMFLLCLSFFLLRVRVPRSREIL